MSKKDKLKTFVSLLLAILNYRDHSRALSHVFNDIASAQFTRGFYWRAVDGSVLRIARLKY